MANMDDKTKNSSLSTFWIFCALTACVLCGAYLRLVNLGHSSMGADVMEFYKISNSEVPVFDLIFHSDKYIGKMPPLWFAVHNAYHQWLNIPVTFQSMRVPDALAGIATIIASFFLLRCIAGNTAGIIAAILATFQPLMIQMSRECYFYAPIVLGCILGMLTFILFVERIHCDATPPLYLYFLLGISFLLLTHIQISSWPYATVLGAGLLLLLGINALKKKINWMPFIICLALFLAIGIPTLLYEWGMSDVIQLMFGEGKEQWGNIFQKEEMSLLQTLTVLGGGYMFGTTPVRLMIAGVLFVCGFFFIVKHWNHDDRLPFFVYFSLGSMAFLVLIHTLSVFPPTPRHYSSIVPTLVVLMALGIVQMGIWFTQLITGNKYLIPIQLVLTIFLVLSLNGRASILSTQLVGQPPYRLIADWMDEHLPDGTVVLCDRWFTPWNEFRINAPQKVTCTFTIPNEPIQQYQQIDWRKTAIQFLTNNPRAAFFEGKEYWAQLGPWDWPQNHFKHSQYFWDAAAEQLDEMGLNYRPLSLNTPDELKGVTVYYNTDEDIIRQSRASGKKMQPLFGSGWTYTKTRDYRDWYAMNERAVLDVYNFTTNRMQANIDLIGIAVQQAKQIVDPVGKTVVIQPNQLQQIHLHPQTLLPGFNALQLRDSTGSGTPLLVQKINISISE